MCRLIVALLLPWQANPIRLTRTLLLVEVMTTMMLPPSLIGATTLLLLVSRQTRRVWVVQARTVALLVWIILIVPFPATELLLLLLMPFVPFVLLLLMGRSMAILLSWVGELVTTWNMLLGAAIEAGLPTTPRMALLRALEVIRSIPPLLLLLTPPRRRILVVSHPFGRRMVGIAAAIALMAGGGWPLVRLVLLPQILVTEPVLPTPAIPTATVVPVLLRLRLVPPLLPVHTLLPVRAPYRQHVEKI